MVSSVAARLLAQGLLVDTFSSTLRRLTCNWDTCVNIATVRWFCWQPVRLFSTLPRVQCLWWFLVADNRVIVIEGTFKNCKTFVIS